MSTDIVAASITCGSVNGGVSYSLDPVGNRSSASSSLTGVSSGSWNFNADDELTSESYDANGNVSSSGGNTFSYNSQNQLISMNGGTVQIVYDGDGNRVVKSANGVVTRYLVDDLNPTGYAQVVEELSGGTVQRQYTYGLQRISQQQAISNTWTPSYYGYDGNGNVRQLTNAAGAVTDTNEFDAFGNLPDFTGTTPNRYLYRGEQFDSDLGLYYLRARYYNSLTGRFMSRDPEAFCDCSISHPAALHKYLYGEDDPIDLADPLGRNAMPVPLPPPPGPVPVPNPEPAPDNARSGASVEYALIVGEISLGSIAGIKSVAQEVNCMLYTAADALGAIGQNLGFLQNVQLNWARMHGTIFESARRAARPV